MIKKIIAAAFVLSLSVGAADAQNCPNYSNALTNGQPADANQVMQNFSSIRDCVNSKVREVLTANRTYFVRADGSDSNNGLANTPGGAFLTIQKGINTVANSIDLGGFNVTIQVANGTYTQSLSLRPLTGPGLATIAGDTTTPSNVLLSVTGANVINGQNFGSGWQVQGVKFTTTTAGHGIYISGISTLTISGKVDFGVLAAGHTHMLPFDSARIHVGAGYTISAAPPGGLHLLALRGSGIAMTGSTITLNNVPAFQFFAAAQGASEVTAAVMTFQDQNGKTRQTAAGNTHSNTTLDGLTINTNLLSNGMIVTGSGIPAGTTIAIVNSSTVTLSQAATTTVTGGTVKFEIARGTKFSNVTAGGTDTAGAGLDYFPGDTAGSAVSPGWYN